MNPVTVRLFDINQHMVVNQFLEMCLSSSFDADGIFATIDKAFDNNGIRWDKCISLGVDNTSVIIGKHHFLITKAREKNDETILIGCPCHMAHNTARQWHLKNSSFSMQKNYSLICFSILIIPQKEKTFS